MQSFLGTKRLWKAEVGRLWTANLMIGSFYTTQIMGVLVSLVSSLPLLWHPWYHCFIFLVTYILHRRDQTLPTSHHSSPLVLTQLVLYHYCERYFIIGCFIRIYSIGLDLVLFSSFWLARGIKLGLLRSMLIHVIWSWNPFEWRCCRHFANLTAHLRKAVKWE